MADADVAQQGDVKALVAISFFLASLSWHGASIICFTLVPRLLGALPRSVCLAIFGIFGVGVWPWASLGGRLANTLIDALLPPSAERLAQWGVFWGAGLSVLPSCLL